MVVEAWLLRGRLLYFVFFFEKIILRQNPNSFFDYIYRVNFEKSKIWKIVKKEKKIEKLVFSELLINFWPIQAILYNACTRANFVL